MSFQVPGTQQVAGITVPGVRPGPSVFVGPSTRKLIFGSGIDWLNQNKVYLGLGAIAIVILFLYMKNKDKGE